MPTVHQSDSIVTRNLTVEELLTLAENSHARIPIIGTPGSPPAGWVGLYGKSDKRLYLLDSDGNEVVLDATTGGAVLKSLFDQYTLLVANTDNMPSALALAASQVVGRKASGGIAAVGMADLAEMLGLQFSTRIAGEYYDGAPWAITPEALSTVPIVADTLWAIPVWSWGETVDRLGIEVAVAEAGKSVRLGFYEGTGGAPGGLILQTGDLSLGSVAFVEAAISQALPFGRVYSAILSDSAGTARFRGMDRRNTCGFNLGDSVATTAGYTAFCKTGQAFASGLPDPFPTSPTRAAATPFRVLFRRAA